MGLGTLVDSSVLLDLFTNDATWADWSQQALEKCAERGPLLINSIIYAEVSVGFRRIEECEQGFDEVGCDLIEMPREALFLAGKAFLQYRRRGGHRNAPLPDFFIGAHAAISRIPLLTRDPARVRSNFPTAELIAPE